MAIPSYQYNFGNFLQKVENKIFSFTPKPIRSPTPSPMRQKEESIKEDEETDVKLDDDLENHIKQIKELLLVSLKKKQSLSLEIAPKVCDQDETVEDKTKRLNECDSPETKDKINLSFDKSGTFENPVKSMTKLKELQIKEHKKQVMMHELIQQLQNDQ